MGAYYENAKSKIQCWFNKAADWQKDLFVSIWNGATDESELTKRAVKFIERDSFNVMCKSRPVTDFPTMFDFSEDRNIPVLLTNISDVEGVGAIAATSPLSFDPGLTIVYGENGCGKSSYVRLLKAIENPACSNNVISNVFSGECEQPKAKIAFMNDGAETIVEWTKSSNSKYPIQIYDTEIAKGFVEKENEVVYEPKVLTIITTMVNVYTQISDNYHNRSSIVGQQLADVPYELIGHSLIVRFLSASKAKEIELIKSEYGWNGEFEKELCVIEDTLKESDPQRALSALNARKEIAHKHKSEITRLYSLVSDSSCNEHLEKRRNQIQKKASADEWIKESKKKSLVRGFGESEWKTLWSDAIAFSKVFYGDHNEIPKSEDDLCVLCQQHMSTDVIKRLEFFKRFMQSTAIVDSEKAYNIFTESVRKLQENIDNKIHLDEIELELRSCSLDEDIIQQIIKLYSEILSRCRWLLGYTDTDVAECPRISNIEKFSKLIDECCKTTEAQIESLKKVIVDRDTLESKRLELIARRWMNGKFDAKHQVVKLDSIIKACRTNALTTLKKDLSDLLITSAYIDKFQSELSVLDTENQIKVELVSKGARRGRAYHQVSLKDLRAGEKRKTGEILSEGEFRVVSLAAFLADLSSWNKSMPFVFDDPITSLDQKYEGRVAKRLVSLSAERQVIVFTHRLAFAQLLNAEFNEYSKGGLDVKGTKRLTMKNIELRKSPLGQPCEPNFVKNINLHSAMCEFLKNDISKIKKAQQNGEHDVADLMLKALCSSFRSVIEQGIGHDLLCGIISRFGRNVSTLKVPMLMAITKDDVELFHKMMSKYSCYEHSQSLETPIFLPDITSIEADVIVMRDWASEYKKRCKKAQEIYS